MTPGRRLASVVLCLPVTVVACGGCRVPSQRIVHLETLQLQRSHCFGTCPAYTVAVDADRRVRFAGERYVAVESAERQASSAEIDALVRALNEGGFPRLQDRYETPEDGCEATATDHATVTLTVRFDGVSKSVRHYHGCWTLAPSPPRVQSIPPESPFLRKPPPAPELGCPFPMALVELQNRIDSILRTESWIGNVPYQYERCSNDWAR